MAIEIDTNLPRPSHRARLLSSASISLALHPAQAYAAAFQLLEQKEYNRAMPLMRESAQAGIPMAMYNYAIMLQHGIAGRQDTQIAKEYYQQAFDAGIEGAGSNLYRLYASEGKMKPAVEIMRKLAKGTSETATNAMLDLARCYTDGLGVPRNEGRSLHWLHQAAELGNPNAQYFIGKALQARSEQGYEEDGRDAVVWLALAARKGHPHAAADVSSMLGNIVRPTLSHTPMKPGQLAH